MKEDPYNCRSKKGKKSYIQNIEVMLAQKKTTLGLVKRKINLATHSGRIHPSEQLLKAERQADACIAELRKQLDQLGSANDQSWEKLRFQVDVAWDELSQSIRKIVARSP